MRLSVIMYIVVDCRHFVPCLRSYDPVGFDAEEPLEYHNRVLSSRTENPVNNKLWYFVVILTNIVEILLYQLYRVSP